MKKYLTLIIFCAVTAFVSAQNALTIDNALNNATGYLKGRIAPGSKVVILNFISDSSALTEYIIEELTGYVVNDGTFTVVDRRNLEIIRQEMDFQLSGEVSDETAQSIGQKLGAQTIISGAITAIGDTYRLRIRAISVETAQIQGMQNVDVQQDARLAALTGTSYSPPSISSSSGGPAASNSSLRVNPFSSGFRAASDSQGGSGGKSTARVSVNRETIDGIEHDVINMEVNLIRGIEGFWAEAITSNNIIIAKLKNASGVRFKVYGDGKSWWLELVAKEGIETFHYRGRFNTSRNRVVEIDIPYSKLIQPNWSKRGRLNKGLITELKFYSALETTSSSSIKVFDLEIY